MTNNIKLSVIYNLCYENKNKTKIVSKTYSKPKLSQTKENTTLHVTTTKNYKVTKKNKIKKIIHFNRFKDKMGKYATIQLKLL